MTPSQKPEGIERFDLALVRPRLPGMKPMDPELSWSKGEWVRYSDHQERVKELEEELRLERDAATLWASSFAGVNVDFNALVSAVKQWRNATESRLRMLDSRGEAAKVMLKPDRDLIEALERVDG